MVKGLKDPVSALTHFFGVIIALLGTILLEYLAAIQASLLHHVSFAIYGTSSVLLYTASTLYHSLPLSERIRKVFRKIDHMMIFVLIAGTYTPICLIALKNILGYSLLGIVWGIAIIGIILKALWLDAPRWLSTALYILMGWLVVVALYPLMKSLPIGAFIWLLAGGIVYTLGGLIYAIKWPKIQSKWFGFHEIFHLFVLGGWFCHFWVMYRYVLYL